MTQSTFCLCSYLILHKYLTETETQKTHMNMLASTSNSSTALGGWTVLQLSKIRNNRSVSSSFSLRISATCDDRPLGPSCIYVGPLQSATQETLEALYSQVTSIFSFLIILLMRTVYCLYELKTDDYNLCISTYA